MMRRNRQLILLNIENLVDWFIKFGKKIVMMKMRIESVKHCMSLLKDGGDELLQLI